MLKTAERSATLSFCPSGPFLAAGSVSGAISLSFDSSSTLEIFRLDFASPDHDLKLAGGAVQAPERFARLCWGPPTPGSKDYQYGLIAGGLADGSVCVWNPARIIGQKAAPAPTSPAASRGQLLARLQKHAGAVKGLEFNSFSPNLLASGGGDGELCIWDVGNPLQPSLYPAMQGGAAGPKPEITHLAWNRKVQHILGTCTAAGTVVVWDLKKQRPVISFKDPSGRKRCSAIQWNPEVATQLMVASDDDMSPALQLWDLRNSVSPVREYHGHAKGVLGMSWCPQDASFLLSSAKDNRTICWDVNSGEVYCELPPGSNWNFDVQWAPGQLAGLFATATFEGHIGISSLGACTAAAGDATDGFSIGQAAPTSAKTKAPAWLKRPCGATFGFGGKLVQFANSKRQLPTGETVETGSVTVSQVLTEPELVQRSEVFEQAVAGGDRDALRSFCQERAAALGGSEEAETWAFLATHFAADGRRYLLERLGFSDVLPAEPEPEASEAAPAAEEAADAAGAADAAAEQVQQLSLEQQQAAAAAAGQLLADDGADFFDKQSPTDGAAFFDNLASTPPRPSPLSPRPGQPPVPGSPKEPPIIDGPPGEGEEGLQKLLFVANYAGAVDAAIEANRHADAMVIASVVGGELWDKARKAYMVAHPRPFMRMLHSVLSGDWMAFVAARHPGAWRETLAAILTSAPYDQFEGLLSALAGRLAAAGMPHAATLCCICGGDVDAAVRQWGKAAVGKDGGAPSVDALEALMEKAVVLGLGVNKASASEALSDLIERYAQLLAANGRLKIALEYLQMIPGEASGGVAVLKERLYRAAAGSDQVPAGMAPPPFPFTAEDVTASPYEQQQAVAAGGYGQQAAAGGYNQQAAAYGQQAAATAAYGQQAAVAPSYGQQAAPSAYQQQAAAGYGSQYGGYAAQPSPNGYSAASAGYSSAAGGYGSLPSPAQPQPQPTPQQAQQFATYSSYGAAGQQQQQQAPPPQAQPQAYQPTYGGMTSPRSATAEPPRQQPAVFQPSAAPPPATAPPPAVYQPSAAPQAYTPAAAPQAYTPTAGAQGYGAPPVGLPPTAVAPPPAAAPAPPPVYQPQAAPAPAPTPTVYQQAPAAPSAVAPPAVYTRSGSLTGAGPTPTPITAPPPPPPAPPANICINTADVSSVPPHLQPVVASLTNLYRVCEAAAGAHPGKKREVEDSSKKLGALFWKMNKGEVSQSVAGKLLQLCQALDAGDFVMATHLQVSLTTSDWDECAAWLTALKRLIKARHTMG